MRFVLFLNVLGFKYLTNTKKKGETCNTVIVKMSKMSF